MRPWEPADGDLSETREGGVKVTVNAQDTPGPGGMIAKSDIDPLDQWYISAKYFGNHYEVL